MGKHIAIYYSLILKILLCMATCNIALHQDFLTCMSTNYNTSSNADEELAAKCVHNPGSPEYSSLLNTAEKNSRWLNSTSASPLFVVAPHDEVQIRYSLMCSQKLGLQVRIKSGGHDYEGLSFRCKNPFIMIDLCNFRSIKIDVKEESAWIQTGVTLGQLYHAIARKSDVHAFPGGLYPSVGSGGLISGGGLGTLVRKYGLAADNVVDARVMDHSGRILDRKTMGEDFFWAIKGGGGASFGIILAWKLKLVGVPKLVTAFTFRRKLDCKTAKLVRKWEKNAHAFPDDLFMRLIVQNEDPVLPGRKKIVQLSFQGLFLGTADEFVPLLDQYFPEFKLKIQDCFRVDPVVTKDCREKPCIKKECYQVPWIRSVLYFTGRNPEGPLEYLVRKNTNESSNFKAKSDFVSTPIPYKGWKMIKRMFLQEDYPLMILDPFGGRMSEISEGKIPFPHRKGNLYNIQYLVNWKDNGESESNKQIEWIRRLHHKMEPFVSKSPRAAYFNYRDLDLGVNGEGYQYDQARSWGEMYFKHNFRRLAMVKSRVDPHNFFRYEQSIPLFH